MKKDHIRDYATAAFRYYALLGLSAEQYKKKVWLEALESKNKSDGGSGIPGSPTESQLIHAEKMVDEQINSIKDIEAVEKVIEECSRNNVNGYYILEMIKRVYFVEASEALKKGEIHSRTIKACTELSISEKTAYRYLKSARKLFAYNRGLRD